MIWNPIDSAPFVTDWAGSIIITEPLIYKNRSGKLTYRGNLRKSQKDGSIGFFADNFRPTHFISIDEADRETLVKVLKGQDE